MDVVDVLLGARDRLAQGFVKFRRAQTADGNFVYGNSPKAVAWCAVGAIECVLGEVGAFHYPLGESALRYLRRALPTSPGFSPLWAPVVNYNNHPDTTQQDMVELFDEAARLAKDEAA